MDEEETPIKYKGIEITTDDAIAFLNSLGAAPACPVCAHRKWGINFTPGSGQYVELTTRSQKPGQAVFGVAVYLVTCDRCGYSRTHTISAVHEWMSERTAQGNGGAADATEEAE